MSDQGPYAWANPDIFGGPDNPPLAPGSEPTAAGDAVAANPTGRYPAAVQHAGAPAVGTRYPGHQYAPPEYPDGHYPALQYVAGQYTADPRHPVNAYPPLGAAPPPQGPDGAYTVNPRAHGLSTPYGIDTPYQSGYLSASARQAHGLGTAALITGILGLGPIPLILGIVGIRRAKGAGNTGYGMSLAGIILGALSTLGWLAVFLGITHMYRTDSLPDPLQQQLIQYNLGECAYQTVDGSFDPIACDSSHTAEVVGVDVLPLGAFPGSSSLQAHAQQFCADAFENYVGAPAGSTGLGVEFTVPTPVQWNLGNRQVVCWATNARQPLPAGSIADAGR